MPGIFILCIMYVRIYLAVQHILQGITSALVLDISGSVQSGLLSHRTHGEAVARMEFTDSIRPEFVVM